MFNVLYLRDYLKTGWILNENSQGICKKKKKNKRSGL